VMPVSSVRPMVSALTVKTAPCRSPLLSSGSRRRSSLACVPQPPRGR
jgi:hypothetical protein